MQTSPFSIRLFLTWTLLVLSLHAVCSCGSQQSSDKRTPEEIRLDRSTRIDSTTLPSVLHLDSIAGYEKLSSLTAEAWILVEDSLGLLISSKSADQLMHPASLTKMMTCLLALEHGRKNDTISITPDVFVTKDSRVRPGDAFVVEKLIYEMMMQSDNVAAVALGKFVGGDTLTFHRMMNEKAGYLHMDSTHFVNANGMPVNAPSVGNMSTARDLLILSRYCMDDSLFAQIVGTRQMDIPFIDHRHMPIQNTNLLLEQYKGCIGVKTGYTRQAGACLASAATRNGITLHLVLLKSKTHASRFTESAILFDYGFNVMEAFLGHQDN